MKVEVREWGGIDLIPENNFEKIILNKIWNNGCQVVSMSLGSNTLLLGPKPEDLWKIPPLRKEIRANESNTS